MLWLSAGLPERAAFVGQAVGGLGYVAPEVGAFAPPFFAYTPEGQRVTSSQWLGQTAVINFWATWCEPCALEMPDLQEVFEATAVTVIGINLGETPQAIQGWRAKFGITFPLLIDDNNAVARAYQLRGQPTTFVIASDGRIRHIFYGATNVQTLLTVVHSLQDNTP